MKALHNLYGKKLLPLPILLLLILSLLSALNVNIPNVSALDSPAIYIEPAITESPSYTVGTYYNISIKTDYVPTFTYITSYQFSLSYNPNVLHGGIQKTDWDIWAGDNVTKIFNTTLTPVVPDSEEVYVNQTLMTKYAEKTDTWTGDGVTTTFFTSQTPIVDSLEAGNEYQEQVIVNQTQLKRYKEYTIDHATGRIWIETAPETDVEVEVIYFYGHYAIDYTLGEITFTTAPETGVEVKAIYMYDGVVNGDVIVGGSASFAPGDFNNTEGTLSRTVGLYRTAGEYSTLTGILANVTFLVVGKGNSTITLGTDTELRGWNIFLPGVVVIIDAETMPDQILHGYFDNRFLHDVAVVSVSAPDKAAVGESVDISVEVANVGASAEVANVTIRYGSTLIGFNDTVVLPLGESEPVLFSWGTTGLAQGNYTINATATIPPGDEDPTDNWKTTKIFLSMHDVAVGSVSAPDKAAVGESVDISVEVENVGASAEVANVTIRYGTTYIDSQNVTLLVGKSDTAPFSWNTTGLAQGNYTINATATIPEELYTTDNSNTTTILIVEHDVALISLDAPTEADFGDQVPINVTVANLGASNENVTLTVYYIWEKSEGPHPVGEENSSVLLAAGNSTTIVFSWNTTDLVARGKYAIAETKYKINVTATIPPGDDDPTDNTIKPAIITLKSHDLKIISVQASPYKVFVGELVEIEVKVNNVGMYNETFTVKVTHDTNIIGENQSISLSPGNSISLQFIWNTTNIAPDSYRIKAEAILAEGKDIKPKDNTKYYADVFINPPVGTIVGNVTDVSTGLPIPGANITAGDYSNTTDATGHYNIIDVLAGTYNVTASATGYESSSKTSIIVVAGETTTLNFTLTLLPTVGTIAGIVKDSSGDPIVDAIVTVNNMSATTNSSGVYVISNVPAGTYTVTASATGYESSSKTNITVVAGETTTVDFELTRVQPLDILLYAGVAAAAIIIIAGIAVYILKVRKPT